MREIAYDRSFQRQFKKVVKNNKDLEKKVFEILKIMREDIFDKRLSTHKLSGERGLHRYVKIRE